MNIHRERKTITISAGSGSANTYKFNGAELVQLIVEPTSPVNIYDISVLDENSSEVFGKLACEGDFEEHAIFIPLVGIYTITLSNATVDEVAIATFTVED